MSQHVKIFEELKPKGFIEDFTNTLCERIKGINPDWAQACAETLLSACCFNVHSYTEIGRVILALWSLCIGVSGENKSVPLMYYVIPILRAIQGKLPKHLRILISRFSPEGLIQFMTWHEVEVFNDDTGESEKFSAIGNRGMIVRDEFTSMVKGVKNKKWLCDLSELLSEIYDGHVEPRHTVSHGTQHVPECILAFLSAATKYIYQLIDETFFIQGLGNRIDYYPFDPPKNPPRLTEEFFEYGNKARQEAKIQEYADKLYRLITGNEEKKTCLGYVGLLPGAQQLWLEYDYKIKMRKKTIPEDDLRYSYLSRQAEKALRRASVYCISRNLDAILHRGLAEILANEEDMKLAIATQEKLYQNFLKFLDDWTRCRKEPGVPKTDLADRQLILATVKRLTKELGLVSLNLLSHETDYNKTNQQFLRTLGSLVAEGEIEVIEGEDSRVLVAKMTGQEMARQRIKKPRGNPPNFYKYVGK